MSDERRLTELANERDRYREAVGRLREALTHAARACECAGYVESALDAADVLAATTDEAIRGYDAPPEPDAVLVAKANAALVAEVETLRAERDAAAREADGLRFVAFETEKALGEALTALDLFSTLAGQVESVKSAALGRVLDAREKANAALVAELEAERAARMEVATHYNEARDEVAELRAELAAERGQAEGALPGWRRAFHPSETDNGSLWVMEGRDFEHEQAVGGVRLVVTEDRIRVFDAAGLLVSIRRDDPSFRASMRAAEAEARRLGLLGEVEHG